LLHVSRRKLKVEKVTQSYAINMLNPTHYKYYKYHKFIGKKQVLIRCQLSPIEILT
jgi:hypothetical protein